MTRRGPTELISGRSSKTFSKGGPIIRKERGMFFQSFRTLLPVYIYMSGMLLLMGTGAILAYFFGN